MKAWRSLAFAVVASASTAFAAPDEVPPRVELPLGPYVRPGRPLDVRVLGGADRVRAPGTPWALPQGERGDEFILQMPAAVGAPVELTVRRGTATSHVRVQAQVLPTDEVVVALFGDAVAPAGAVVIRPAGVDAPTVDSAWRMVDAVLREPTDNVVAPPMGVVPNPLRSPPDPQAYSALAEAAAMTPLVRADLRNALLLLCVTEAALLVLLWLRRDRPWTRAAWLWLPAVAAAAYIATSAPTGSALRAVPFVIEDEDGVVEFVRVEALRDGDGALTLPDGARDVAVVRFSASDDALESFATGPWIEASLRAGQTRLFAFRCLREKRLYLNPLTAPVAVAPTPEVARWLGRFGLVPSFAQTDVDPGHRPIGRGIDVLPGVFIAAAPTK